MWPWEHLAFGYLLYSAYVRVRYGHPPDDVPVVGLVLATQLPDLVDKPLAWSFQILPAGRSLAHSLFVGAGVVLAVAVLSRRFGNPAVRAAVAIGYASHLLGDVIYPLVYGSLPEVRFLLWPLVRAPAETPVGLTDETIRLFVQYAIYLVSPEGWPYLFLQTVLLVGMMALWIADGVPGLGLGHGVPVAQSEDSP